MILLILFLSLFHVPFSTSSSLPQVNRELLGANLAPTEIKDINLLKINPDSLSAKSIHCERNQGASVVS